MSAAICDQPDVRAQKLSFKKTRILKRRISYISKAARLIDSLQVFMHPRQGSPLQRAMQQRPELVGVVIWPFTCSSWDAKTCLQRIDQHFRVIETMNANLDFPCNDALTLLDLSDVATNLSVVLDQPKWFMREGLFVINLFALDVRIYSLAFSFAFEDDMKIATIGAIQGVDTEGILDDYKDMTKALHGMRPRDFLVEVFRIFSRCVGLTRICAVDDAKRQHRSSYFGAADSKTFFMNYNDIWIERGGVKGNEDFYDLSMETPMKNLEEVASKKRAMYRRRYELLQSIEQRMQVTLKDSAVSKTTDLASANTQ